MKILTLLTGRGNNTLSDKNIRLVAGKPLLHYIASAAKNSRFESDFYCSSDCDRILAAGSNLGYAPIKRPPELGLPTAEHGDVIRHSLEFLADQQKTYDVVVVLLANSVTVKTEWIEDCIGLISKDDSITAVVPSFQNSDHHPIRCKKLDKDGFLVPYLDLDSMGRVPINRQELEPSYFLSHNFWVIRTACVWKNDGQKPWVFMGSKVMPYVTEEGFDVHTEEDLLRSEIWLKRNNLIAGHEYP